MVTHLPLLPFNHLTISPLPFVGEIRSVPLVAWKVSVLMKLFFLIHPHLLHLLLNWKEDRKSRLKRNKSFLEAQLKRRTFHTMNQIIWFVHEKFNVWINLIQQIWLCHSNYYIRPAQLHKMVKVELGFRCWTSQPPNVMHKIICINYMYFNAFPNHNQAL